jgi:hypothetical protein
MLTTTFRSFATFPLLIVLAVGFALSIIISVFGSIFVYYSASLGWNGIAYVPVIWAFWYLILLAGQIVYQLTAQLVALAYFTHESVMIGTGSVWKRAFGYNLGISGFNALLLPFFQPFYFWAKLDPLELRFRLRAIPEKLAIVISNIFGVIHDIAVSICSMLDQELMYPNERGVIYSALFGITRSEGCRRVAEIDLRVYADLMSANCYADPLLGFMAEVLEIAMAILGWVVAAKLGDVVEEESLLRIKRVGAALGFFVTFALLYILRTFVRAVIETLFICFYELPEQMSHYSADADAKIRKEYEDAVQRKRAIVAQRSEVALLSRETLG